MPKAASLGERRGDNVIPGERERIASAREGDPGLQYRPGFNAWVPFPRRWARLAGNDSEGVWSASYENAMPGLSTNWKNASTTSSAASGMTNDGAGRAGCNDTGPKAALA